MMTAAYVEALNEYVAGRTGEPPCLRCAGPIHNGGLTGAIFCSDCLLDEDEAYEIAAARVFS